MCQQRSPPPSSMPRHSAEPPWPQYESSTFAFYQTFSPQSGLFRQFSLNWKDKCTLFTFFNNIPMKTAFVIFDLNTFNFQTFYLVSQSYKALASERILYFISPIYLQFIVNNFLVIWKEKRLIRLSFPIRWNQETEIPSKKVVLESSEFVERGPKASVKWKNLATNIFEQWFPTK